MSVVVIEPPEPVVSLADAKAHLRVRFDDDDVLIGAYIDAATGHIDGPAGWLGRSLGPQTLELRLDDLCDLIRLPCEPVLEVLSVIYIDAAGVEQTLDAEIYQFEDGRLSTSYGSSWPSLRGNRGGVRILYRAGYEALPPAIYAAILLMVGDLYSNRETSATGAVAASIPMSTTVEALLGPFRVWIV